MALTLRRGMLPCTSLPSSYLKDGAGFTFGPLFPEPVLHDRPFRLRRNARSTCPRNKLDWWKRMTIYVRLLDEGTDAWYPVEAVPVSDGIYEIVGKNPDPEDLHWEFGEGSKVRCRPRQLSDGPQLVAYELVG